MKNLILTVCLPAGFLALMIRLGGFTSGIDIIRATVFTLLCWDMPVLFWAFQSQKKMQWLLVAMIWCVGFLLIMPYWPGWIWSFGQVMALIGVGVIWYVAHKISARGESS